MNREVYKHLWRTYGHNPSQWLGLVAELIRTLCIRIWTFALGAQVVADVAAGDTEAAKRHIVLLTVVAIGGAIAGVAGELLSLHSENKGYEELSLDFHQRLTNKDMALYRDNQTGYLVGVFRQYSDAAMLLVRFFRSDVARAAVSLTAPIIVLLFLDWHIGLVALGLVIVQFFYVMWSSKKAYKYREISNELYRKITGEVSDEITNMVAFKSAGLEEKAHSKIRKLIQQETDAFWHRRKLPTILDLPRSIVTSLGVALAFYLAVESVSTGMTSLGLIVLTMTYMFQINRNVSDVPGYVVQHDEYVAKLFPTLAYLEPTYENIRDPKNPKDLKIKKAEIEVRNVDFSYPSHSGKGKRMPVFKGLSLQVAGGEQVGVVGLSGAGKSTLASLLMRFDDIEAGVITIDGIDIRDVPQSVLRQNIAYVPQEPLLFHRTIQENIAYFDEKASRAEVVRAARAAHIHEFIMGLPDGYETTVGERGIKLSGGQKQRVVIARAVLKKAPIILFDEATSALDSESEQIIQKALPEILGKQTALIIAHRLSTVAGLDRIIVMHHGKIVEQGTHDELLKQKGRYHMLWQKQTNGKD
jgi:ATP-binding cassette, subfamily B, bacterial